MYFYKLKDYNSLRNACHPLPFISKFHIYLNKNNQMNPLTVEVIQSNTKDINNSVKILAFVCFNCHYLIKCVFTRFELMFYLNYKTKNVLNCFLSNHIYTWIMKNN